jgi:hypothetical protein
VVTETQLRKAFRSRVAEGCSGGSWAFDANGNEIREAQARGSLEHFAKMEGASTQLGRPGGGSIPRYDAHDEVFALVIIGGSALSAGWRFGWAFQVFGKMVSNFMQSNVAPRHDARFKICSRKMVSLSSSQLKAIERS